MSNDPNGPKSEHIKPPPRIDAVVRVDVTRGLMWVCGDPDDLAPTNISDEQRETMHDCDAMGCGSVGPHIIAITILPSRAVSHGYMNSALSAEDLVERAVRNAGRGGRYPKVRWGYVADLFAIGSTSASKLCRCFDLDPDEMLGEYPDEEDL